MIAADVQLDAIVRHREHQCIRLYLLSREPDPYQVETFRYETWQEASVARAKLQNALIETIDKLTARIKELGGE